MSPYELTCPDCTQQIEVSERGREATVASGCPFCGTTVATTDFASC